MTSSLDDKQKKWQSQMEKKSDNMFYPFDREKVLLRKTNKVADSF